MVSRSLPPCWATGAGAALGRAPAVPLNLALWVWGFFFPLFVLILLLDTYCLGSWPALTFAETLPG